MTSRVSSKNKEKMAKKETGVKKRGDKNDTKKQKTASTGVGPG